MQSPNCESRYKDTVIERKRKKEKRKKMSLSGNGTWHPCEFMHRAFMVKKQTVSSDRLFFPAVRPGRELSLVTVNPSTLPTARETVHGTGVIPGGVIRQL